MKRYLLLLIVLLAAGGVAQAQQNKGVLFGKITDAQSNEELLGATVILFRNGERVDARTFDETGEYRIPNLDPGVYEVWATAFSYDTARVTGIRVSSGSNTEVNLKIPPAGYILETVVVKYEAPIIEKGKPSGATTFGSEQIMSRGQRSFGALQGAAARVVQTDEGQATFAGGGRADANEIFIDGVRARGNLGLSDMEAEEVQIMTGGLSAAYGDAVGAITNLTTKAPGRNFGGYLSAETSQYLDAFGSNRLDFGLNGPILRNKKTDQNAIGFRLSGTYFTSLDRLPSALGSFRLRDEVLDSIRENPTFYSGPGVIGISANNITDADLLTTNVRPNNRDAYFQGSGTIYFRLNKNMQFRVGGQYYNETERSAFDAYRLLNYDRNPVNNNNDWRVRGEFRHVVPTSDSGFIRNVQYSIQADYTRNFRFVQDPVHKDRLFNYGYIGVFREQLAPVFGIEQVDSSFQWVHSGYNRDFIDYTPNYDINPVLAHYNDPMSLAFTDPTIFDFPNRNGSFNDQFDQTIGDLHTNAGIVYNLYQKSQFNQLGIRVNASFELSKPRSQAVHNIQLGMVFEQRVDRSYSLNPVGLWNLANLYANSHLDFAPDTSIIVGDTVLFNPITNGNQTVDIYANVLNPNSLESGFSQNLRARLGVDNRTWLNVYALSPDFLTLDMFEASELIQGQNRVLSYYGFDHLGNPLGTDITFNDFFTRKVNGRYTRPVAPNAPTYAAGYIEDRFSFKDMYFSLGMRVDIYDANTKVLRDPYTIYGAFSAQEIQNSDYVRAQAQIPASVGDDWMVYVTDPSDPTNAQVTAFRDGDQWYNAQGVAVNTPDAIAPFLLPARRDYTNDETINKTAESVTVPYDPETAFVDFNPSVIVMPRISFTFPINEVSQFFAHYDVVAQRPPSNTLATAMDYFNFNQLVFDNAVLNNPALRPQRKIDYEVGYEQALSKKSSLKLSLYYNEFRDMIQVRTYYRAYPQNYETFANNDFATAKGFVAEYSLRRVGNLQLMANYTLQFAEGTGSDATSNRGYTSILRQVFPLNYDQRHAFYVNLDYRFFGGKEYNGPKLFGKNILANTGANFEFNVASGTPYTRKAIADKFGGLITQGSLNGARLPWNFRVDFKLDKNITLGKKGQNGFVKHPMNLNIYLRVQNLFNTSNVLSVYPYTGSPYSDGYLTDPRNQGPALLNSLGDLADNYTSLYNLRMLNPSFISLPRRIFIGATFNF
jgi:hypothetical protein